MRQVIGEGYMDYWRVRTSVDVKELVVLLQEALRRADHLDAQILVARIRWHKRMGVQA